MSQLYTLTLTQEEVEELERTLIGRIDLDLDRQIQDSTDSKRIVRLAKMKEANQSILGKALDTGVNVF